MKMKRKIKTVFKTAFAVFLTFIIFGVFIYGYLYINVKNEEHKSEAQAKENRIPYEEQAPESKGILLNFESGNYTLMYLDFKQSVIYLVDLGLDPQNAQKYGFPTDYKVNVTGNTVRVAVDLAGGVDLVVEDTSLRYTGIQITELLSYSTDTSYLRKQILLSFFENIQKNGITLDALINIFENSETDLAVPDYYKWPTYIENMSNRVLFVN